GGMGGVFGAIPMPRTLYLSPMVPAAVAFGALTLDRLGRAARLPAGAALALVAVIQAWSTLRPLARDWLATLRAPESAPFRERDLEDLGAALAARLPAGTLVRTGRAPWGGGYAGLPSVTLPLATADLDELRARHHLGAALITNEWLITLPGNEPWRDAFEGARVPPGWRAADVYTFGRLRARLLL